MIYSNNVYELRKQCKISQEKLAHDLDISRRSISKIENGHYIPSIPVLKRIAEGLGTSRTRTGNPHLCSL